MGLGGQRAHLFGVNFADGRIKGYGLTLPGGRRRPSSSICVRGNPNYGVNDFVDNGDGTVTDHATGLMWSQDDSGAGLNWEEALAWVEQRNAETYLGPRRLAPAQRQGTAEHRRLHALARHHRLGGHRSGLQRHRDHQRGRRDRLPLLLDRHDPRELDRRARARAGAYVAFGRALGYMERSWRDVHGAGAQRSDPKEGDPADWPYGNGPQGDAIRIYNYVRLVRGRRRLSSPMDSKPVTRRFGRQLSHRPRIRLRLIVRWDRDPERRCVAAVGSGCLDSGGAQRSRVRSERGGSPLRHHCRRAGPSELRPARCRGEGGGHGRRLHRHRGRRHGGVF